MVWVNYSSLMIESDPAFQEMGVDDRGSGMGVGAGDYNEDGRQFEYEEVAADQVLTLTTGG